MAPECPDCEVPLSRGGVCRQCGFQAPGKGSQEPAKIPSLCPADNGRLQADGWCPDAGGYYAHMNCPFVCPICRHRLGWDGGCEACHGCATGRREDWTFLGDRYELDAGHWRKVLDGPRRICTPDENIVGAQTVARTLAPLKARAVAPVNAQEPLQGAARLAGIPG